MDIKEICNDLYTVAGAIYKELGSGFPESVIQNALAIEFRENEISYLKEVNIEIFYKDQSIGTDRPDFILLPNKKRGWQLNKPIALEIKVASKIKDDHRQQLISYFKSFPHNKNSELRKINKGILLKFLKNDVTLESTDNKNSDIEIEFWSYRKGKDSHKKEFRLPEAENTNE